VVIDVDPRFLPFGIFIGRRRQRSQSRPVDSFVKTPAGAVHLLELAVVHVRKLFGNSPVQLPDAEEGMVAKRRQNPSLRYKNRRFCFGLVLRFGNAGRNDDRSIMLSQIMIGRIDVRFVVAGFAHAGL